MLKALGNWRRENRRREEERRFNRQAEAALKKAALFDTEALAQLQAGDSGLGQAAIEQLIKACQADSQANLFTRFASLAPENRPAFERQVERYDLVGGKFKKAVMEARSTLMPFLLGCGVIGAMFFITRGQEVDWYWNVGVGGITMALGPIFMREWYKSRAFVEAVVLERRHFTDLTQASGWLQVRLPRLAFYGKPEVWRGKNAHNGFYDDDAYLVLQAGAPIVTWLDEDDRPMPEPPDLVGEFYGSVADDAEEQELDEQAKELEMEMNAALSERDEACAVAFGPRLVSFRVPTDYYGLQADPYTTSCEEMRERRAWHRALQRGALGYKKAKERGDNWSVENLELLVGLGGMALGIVLLFWALG